MSAMALREVAGKAKCSAPAAVALSTQAPGPEAITTRSPWSAASPASWMASCSMPPGARLGSTCRIFTALLPEDVRPQPYVIVGAADQRESFCHPFPRRRTEPGREQGVLDEPLHGAPQ